MIAIRVLLVIRALLCLSIHSHFDRHTLCPERLQLKLKQRNQIREMGGKDMGK